MKFALLTLALSLTTNLVAASPVEKLVSPNGNVALGYLLNDGDSPMESILTRLDRAGRSLEPP